MAHTTVLAPDVRGVGWVLVSTVSKRMIYGEFHEHTDAESSYRGERLGLTVSYHIISFVLKYYIVQRAQGSIHCDNRGALIQALTKCKRIKQRTKHSDLIKKIWHIKATHMLDLQYMHVKAHQDDHFTWDDLALFQQINIHYNLLAKQAVQDAIINPNSRSVTPLLLSYKQAAILVAGNKQTSDAATSLHFALGLINARKYFVQPIRIRNDSNIGGFRVDCTMTWCSTGCKISNARGVASQRNRRSMRHMTDHGMQLGS